MSSPLSLLRSAKSGQSTRPTPSVAAQPTPATSRGRPPEIVPTEEEAQGLRKLYLKTNRNRTNGSMTLAARQFAKSEECSPELREAILRERGPARASKHQIPLEVKRAMMASAALTTFARNPRDADVMMGHARGVLRRHWAEDRRLWAGERWSSDDGTVNFVVTVPWPWGGCRCSDRYGVKVGRFELLMTNDDASDFPVGWTYVIRQSSSYRAEDVCGALGRLWRDVAKPDLMVLERGTWESKRVQALCDAAGVEVARSYAPRQKLVENLFNRLWTYLSVLPGNVGRYRGEMERENKLLAATQAGRLDPREVFVDLGTALDSLEKAVGEHARTPLESRHYGTWIPEERWREDLAAHPRPTLDPSMAHLWAPEVRTWTVRRASVGGMVETPLGVSLPAHWWCPELLECEGRAVTVHFDPWEVGVPATLTLAEPWPVRGWNAGRVLATAVPCLEDLPTISREAANAIDSDGWADALERGKRMRATLRQIVMREYRALGIDGRRARREIEVRAPEVAPSPAARRERETVVAAPRRLVAPAVTEDDLAQIEAAERRARAAGLIPSEPF